MNSVFVFVARCCSGKTPHGFFKLCFEEEWCAHVSRAAFLIKHPMGLIRTMASRTVVRKFVLKLVVFDKTSRRGL